MQEEYVFQIDSLCLSVLWHSSNVRPQHAQHVRHVLTPSWHGCFMQENEVQLMANRLHRLEKGQAKA
eukprot:COSAG04_NODE_411_length_14759_cov_28.639520_4_plen_67_part_00